MRKLMLLIACCALPVWAQVSIPSGQTRTVVTDAEVGDSVGDAIIAVAPAMGSILGFTILSQDNTCCTANVPATEIFFNIDNGGQITVAQDLMPFFPFGTRASVAVVLTIKAIDDGGMEDTETVVVNIVQAEKPFILPNQVFNTNSAIELDTEVAEVSATGTPTSWTIQSGNEFGAFSISPNGTITNTIFLDVLNFANVVGNQAIVSLTVVATNDVGPSDPEVVTVNIALVSSNRCGEIPPTQTRFVNVSSGQGTMVGDPIESDLLDAIWIEDAWIQGQPPNSELGTIFKINDVPPGSEEFGQIEVFRALTQFPTLFPPDQITRVTVLVRGDSDAGQCPPFIEDTIAIYVIPDDMGGAVNDPNGPDISNFIADPLLLNCIRAALGGELMITAEDALTLTQLDCACLGITDLDGLELFTELTTLNLSNNMINDIRPITNLLQLTALRFAGNLITDITNSNPLASLINLTKLDLSNNQIVDSNAFSTLVNLEFLSLADNQICDVASLVALTGLSTGGLGSGDTVILDNNFLSSAAALQQISALETTGAFVTHFGNNFVCPSNFSPIVLETWPVNDINVFADLLNNRGACPNDPP